MRLILFAVIALLIPVSAAHADVKDPVFLLQNDESLLHISATEQREVDQDLLVASLRVESENKDNRKVQNDINTAMAKALELAKKYDDVKAITRSYNVYEYDRNGGKRDTRRDMVWKGTQSVQLKSKNAEELLELAGKIQGAGFIMGGLNYTLSPQLAAQVQDEMLEAALEKLSARAERAAKALGKDKAELKEIQTQGQYTPRPPVYARGMAMEMAADVKMAAPVASPGETTLNMTVSAKALLR